MSWVLKLFRRRKRKLVNLYHHLSRALFYDVDTKVLIGGIKAIKLLKKLKRCKEVGYLKIDDAVFCDVWGDGKLTIIYGAIYEV